MKNFNFNEQVICEQNNNNYLDTDDFSKYNFNENFDGLMHILILRTNI